MLEGITIALQSHYDTANGAKDILEKAVVQIKANYIGAMLAEKMKETQEIYNNTLAESRTANYKACVAILDEVSGQARKVVGSPVSPDFVATLEAIKQMKEPTKTEIETIVSAYKNNYFAYRAISDFLGIVPKPMTIDDIEADIEYIKENLYQCFYSDNVEGYHFRNWKDGSLVEGFDEVFRAFTEGRFEDAVQPDADAQDNE